MIQLALVAVGLGFLFFQRKAGLPIKDPNVPTKPTGVIQDSNGVYHDVGTSGSLLKDATTVINDAKTVAQVGAVAVSAASALGLGSTATATTATIAATTAAETATTAATAGAAATETVAAAGATSAEAGAAAGASTAGTVASAAIPLAAVGIIAFTLTLTGDDNSGRWRAQMMAQYGYNPGDIALTNPYTGNIEHFGNYVGLPPTDKFVERTGRGQLIA